MVKDFLRKPAQNRHLRALALRTLLAGVSNLRWILGSCGANEVRVGRLAAAWAPFATVLTDKWNTVVSFSISGHDAIARPGFTSNPMPWGMTSGCGRGLWQKGGLILAIFYRWRLDLFILLFKILIYFSTELLLVYITFYLFFTTCINCI